MKIILEFHSHNSSVLKQHIFHELYRATFSFGNRTKWFNLLYQVQSRRISNEKLRRLHELLAKNTQITNNYSLFDWILVGKPELRSFSTKKSKTTKRTKLETRAIFFGKDFSPTVRDKQRGVGVLTSWYYGPLIILLVAGMRAFPKHAGILQAFVLGPS